MNRPSLLLRVELSPGLLLVVPEEREALLAAGFDRPWELVRPGRASPGAGRGRRGRATLPDGRVLFVKQYLRGGVLARWNRERYFGTGRFVREIDAGRQAEAEGLPVLPTIAVRLAPAGIGWRAWGASWLLAEARSLAERLAEDGIGRNEAEALWLAALRALAAAHAAGLRHADLNLGNLLARPAGSGAWDVRLIDLDRARLRRGPLGPKETAAVLARLERSWRKLLGEGPIPRERRAALAEQAGLLPAASYPA